MFGRVKVDARHRGYFCLRQNNEDDTSTNDGDGHLRRVSLACFGSFLEVDSRCDLGGKSKPRISGGPRPRQQVLRVIFGSQYSSRKRQAFPRTFRIIANRIAFDSVRETASSRSSERAAHIKKGPKGTNRLSKRPRICPMSRWAEKIPCDLHRASNALSAIECLLRSLGLALRPRADLADGIGEQHLPIRAKKAARRVASFRSVAFS